MMFSKELRYSKMNVIVILIMLNIIKLSDASIVTKAVSFAYRNRGVCGNGQSKFLSITNTPFNECLIECGLRPMCKAVNFRRLNNNYCELLFDVETTTGDAGCMYIPKEDMQFTGILTNVCGCKDGQINSPDGCGCEKGERCNVENKTCSTKECVPFEDLANGNLVGNLYSIGSKMLLMCSADYKPKDVSTIKCMASGEWSGNPVCIPAMACPEYWIRYESSCVYISKLSDGLRSFEEAEDFCVSRDSHLVRINTFREDYHLRNEILNMDTGLSYWIGLKRDSLNGSWYWIDNGEGPTFTKWGTRQPNIETFEPFVIMWARDALTWHDIHAYLAGFVCRRPAMLE